MNGEEAARRLAELIRQLNAGMDRDEFCMQLWEVWNASRINDAAEFPMATRQSAPLLFNEDSAAE